MTGLEVCHHSLVGSYVLGFYWSKHTERKVEQSPPRTASLFLQASLEQLRLALIPYLLLQCPWRKPTHYGTRWNLQWVCEGSLLGVRKMNEFDFILSDSIRASLHSNGQTHKFLPELLNTSILLMYHLVRQFINTFCAFFLQCVPVYLGEKNRLRHRMCAE